MRRIVLGLGLVAGFPALSAWAAPATPLVMAPPQPETPPVPSAAHPLTLGQAIARALAAHPDVLAANVNARDATLGVADARAQRMRLTADLSTLGRHVAAGILDPTVPAPVSTDLAIGNANLELSVPVFTGFKITNNIKAAELREKAAGADRMQSVAQLQFEVTRAFWNLRRQERLEEEQAATVISAEKSLKLVQAKRKQGTATPLDVDRAEVELLTVKGDYLAAGTNTQNARAQLASWLGVTPDEVAIDEGQAEQTFVAGRGAKLANHSRVTASFARVEAAKARADATAGDRWPQVGITSAYQHGNNPLNPTTGARGVNTTLSGQWDVRLGISYNLFDMGTINRNVERAENERKLAEADYERTRRDVATQLALANAKVTATAERRKVAESGVKLAERALSYADLRYQQGYASQVEVLDARRSLLRSRSQAVDARYDSYIALAEQALAQGSQKGPQP